MVRYICKIHYKKVLFNSQDSQEAYSLQMKARVLSRKVWELLMLLPTNTDMLDGFQTVSLKDGSQKTDWAELLDPHSPHKLMYSLQIVESLSRPPKHRRRSNVSFSSHMNATLQCQSVMGSKRTACTTSWMQ